MRPARAPAHPPTSPQPRGDGRHHGGSTPPVPGASFREVERPGNPQKGDPSCHAVSLAQPRSSAPYPPRPAASATRMAGTGAAGAAGSTSATRGAASSGSPARTCGSCGEWLPHACAAEITITREKWTGRRVVTVRDRQPADQEPRRPAGPLTDFPAPQPRDWPPGGGSNSLVPGASFREVERPGDPLAREPHHVIHPPQDWRSEGRPAAGRTPHAARVTGPDPGPQGDRRPGRPVLVLVRRVAVHVPPRGPRGQVLITAWVMTAALEPERPS
jgi:hypothetical protein